MPRRSDQRTRRAARGRQLSGLPPKLCRLVSQLFCITHTEIDVLYSPTSPFRRRRTDILSARPAKNAQNVCCAELECKALPQDLQDFKILHSMNFTTEIRSGEFPAI